MSQIKAWEPQADGPGGFADESALAAGLRAGRPDAFEVLHGAYAASIYSLALRIVDDPHDAQDVAQEVLIKVFRGLPPDDGSFRLPAWLYRVTVNAAFDHLRVRKRRPVTVASESAPEAVAAVDEYERAELSRRVESTLRDLPKRQQVALVLRDVHGLSVGETASALGLTKGSADVLLSRARAGFRRVFLAGAATGRCDEAERILAGSVGGGASAADRALLEAHTRTCPDCGRAVALWGTAPVGLGLLVPQVALPATLSLSATLAAAQAAGVALPAGLGAATAAGAAGTAAGASAATVTGAAAPAAAGGAGVLAALGSAAGIKVVALAAVATAAVGIAGVATHERMQGGGRASSHAAVVQGQAGRSYAGTGRDAGDRGRKRALADAHRRGGAGGEPGSAGARGTAQAGRPGSRLKDGGAGAASGAGATSAGDGAAQSGGSGAGQGGSGTSAGQSTSASSGGGQSGAGSAGGGSAGAAGDGAGAGGQSGSGSGSGSGGGQSAAH